MKVARPLTALIVVVPPRVIAPPVLLTEAETAAVELVRLPPASTMSITGWVVKLTRFETASNAVTVARREGAPTPRVTEPVVEIEDGDEMDAVIVREPIVVTSLMSLKVATPATA